jgi:signal peptidase I
MNDTLVNADQLIIDKISYRSHDPQRYDIVVFPENEDSMYVKRIIGLPGETVSISEGYIYINGQMLGDDIYGKETITQDNYGRLYESSVTLGSDEYFVMGDNRNNSTDSRSYDVGNITKDQIIGKVIFRIWPLKRMGVVD